MVSSWFQTHGPGGGQPLQRNGAAKDEEDPFHGTAVLSDAQISTDEKPPAGDANIGEGAGARGLVNKQQIQKRKAALGNGSPYGLLPPEQATVPEETLPGFSQWTHGKLRSWQDFIHQLSGHRRVLFRDEHGNIWPLSGQRISDMQEGSGNAVDPETGLPALAVVLSQLGPTVVLYGDLIGKGSSGEELVPRKPGGGATNAVYRFSLEQPLRELFGHERVDKLKRLPTKDRAHPYVDAMTHLLRGITPSQSMLRVRDRSTAGQWLKRTLPLLTDEGIDQLIEEMMSTRPAGREARYLFNLSAMGLNTDELAWIHRMTKREVSETLSWAYKRLERRLSKLLKDRTSGEFELGKNAAIPLAPDVRKQLIDGDSWYKAKAPRSIRRGKLAVGSSNPEYIGQGTDVVELYELTDNGELQLTKALTASDFTALIRYVKAEAQGSPERAIGIFLELVGPQGEVIKAKDHFISLPNYLHVSFGSERQLRKRLAKLKRDLPGLKEQFSSADFEAQLSSAISKGRTFSDRSGSEFFDEIKNWNGKKGAATSSSAVVPPRVQAFEQERATDRAIKSSIRELKKTYGSARVEAALKKLGVYSPRTLDIVLTFEKVTPQEELNAPASAHGFAQKPVTERDVVKELMTRHDRAENSIRTQLKHGREWLRGVLGEGALEPLENGMDVEKEARIKNAGSLLELRDSLGPSDAEALSAALRALKQDDPTGYNLLTTHSRKLKAGKVSSLGIAGWQALTQVQEYLLEHLRGTVSRFDT